ncbi:MAG: hypothetical protein A6F71_09530 [Cycloclasticus sp. symbiont of Poecilosclerida sp. M]|nr:MAG: hypothetical protein A6F71_09530 [Cycloclasticus sp. symbiont of Poecilosclerida sp. M]
MAKRRRGLCAFLSDVTNTHPPAATAPPSKRGCADKACNRITAQIKPYSPRGRHSVLSPSPVEEEPVEEEPVELEEEPVEEEPPAETEQPELRPRRDPKKHEQKTLTNLLKTRKEVYWTE